MLKVTQQAKELVSHQALSSPKGHLGLHFFSSFSSLECLTQSHFQGPGDSADLGQVQGPPSTP